jgi:hypothetical protein
MTSKIAKQSTSEKIDKIIRFIFGIVLFIMFVSGGTYILQSSLFLLKSLGHLAHWAAILILLPAISGLYQHLISPPARLVVAIMGAILSSMILYPLYAEQFWASPPSITDTIVFTLAIAGIGFTSSINPHDRHVKQRRAIKSRKKSSNKKESHVDASHEHGFTEKLLNSSSMRTFELILTVISIVLGLAGTFSLGMSAM